MKCTSKLIGVAAGLAGVEVGAEGIGMEGEGEREGFAGDVGVVKYVHSSMKKKKEWNYYWWKKIIWDQIDLNKCAKVII